MIQKLKDLSIVIRTTLKDYKYNKYHFNIRKVGGDEVDFANLRKYCHMLDKAMNNPLFERGHSGKIYRDAVELKVKLVKVYGGDSAFTWACEILERFEKAQQEGKPALDTHEPRIYTQNEVTMFSDFMRTRTSCRSFKKKIIPADVIRNIVNIAVDAPNGCCQQTTRFYITQDEEKICKIASNVAGLTNFTNVQCLVAVCADCSHYNLNDKNLQYVDVSFASENFILAAQLYGVYGTICNFFHATLSQINEVKKIYEMNDSENVVLFMAIGYPAFIPEKPRRRSIETFLKIK
jgi:nitroreductase